MAAAKKVKTATAASAKKSAVKKPRLSQQDAEVKMIHATTELLKTTAPADITVQLVSSTAGVHHDYVARYFGSREELFVQAVERTTLAYLAVSQQASPTEVQLALTAGNDLLHLAAVRGRLISYLLACGVSPERFRSTQQLLMANAMKVFQNEKLSERTKRNFVLIATLLIQSQQTMGEVDGLTEDDKEDLRAFLGSFALITELLQENLGWDKPHAKKK
jgi:AcrR family transcriptional regulator